MPRKKIIRRDEILQESEIKITPLKKMAFFSSPLFSLKNIILFAVLVSILLVWKFKSFFVVALVNGQPISRFYLNRELHKKFGSQVLDNIISERLILAAVRQKGILITSGEIDSRMKEIESRLNGKMSLDEALKMQGLTKEDYRRQIEIQLSIDKMFDSQASVSAQEIEDYLIKNQQYYKNATDPGATREEIKGILRQQKIADLFDTWFNDLKTKASVQKFL